MPNFILFYLERRTKKRNFAPMEINHQIMFPGLMAGKKIMYVHGFCSSAQSGTVSRLRAMLPDAEVIAYDLPIHPEEAMALLRHKCEVDKPDLIIGTSMGGMYTEMLYGFDRILVNPAFEMGSTMKEHSMMGKQTFFNPRQDGVQEFIVTKELVKEYREMTERSLTPTLSQGEGELGYEVERVWGLFGMEDPLVHTFDLFHAHYSNAVRFHGEHQLIDKTVIHALIPVIRWIDDMQKGRQREIIYVSIETLRDQYGKPRSSVAKALSMLTEFYDVQFVCPSPTNHPEQVAEDIHWMEDQIGVVAYNHINLTNRPELLYGDYFVSMNKIEGCLGTLIEFGSDQFKTWEEIIEYFKRLCPYYNQ